MTSRYRGALRAAVTGESKAYGFTLVIWGTGALAMASHGSPGKAGAISYVGGALGAMAVVVTISFGGATQEWTSPTLTRVAWGAVHLASVAGALAAGWGISAAIGTKWLAYLAAGAVATIVYQLLLAFEVAASAAEESEQRRHQS